MKSETVLNFSLFSDFDISLFKSGKHFKLYEKLGAHPVEHNGVSGYYFAVWAPSAFKVSVIGNFNQWNDQNHMLHVRWDSSGIWEGFIPEINPGEVYKFKIWSNNHGQILEKADPFAFWTETPPKTASITYKSKYKWKDKKWMQDRANKNALDKPYSVYEMHLASWRKSLDNKYLSYEDIAEQLVAYLKEMKYTHVEFMPIMEYPFDPSWGYQVTGYFAPTSRFGNPEGFKLLVDKIHQAGFGILLDWVPAHFPADEWALANFDGTHLFEHPDLKKGYHPDWKSLIFNFERNEVRSFLISSALYWLEEFHIDGLRVDAVASMIYLDYSREDGEWEPNEFGGRENLAAVSFLREFNEAVYKFYPDVQTIAEESTSFPMVSKPTHIGGLGFGMKWMMGWMNDTLVYFSRDPIYRKFHHFETSFSLTYAFTENFMLPLSHDEVVHGKNSMIYKMPGDEWQKFANLRCLYVYMFTHPGSKLLFMGNDFGQTSEWNHAQSLDWHLLEYDPHQGIKDLIIDLNQLYQKEKALYENQFSSASFEWIDFGDAEHSVICFIRKAVDKQDFLVVVCNMTTVPHNQYRIGVPASKMYKVVLNSDDKKYWGSGFTKVKTKKTESIPWHGRKTSIVLDIPPMSVVVFKPDPSD